MKAAVLQTQSQGNIFLRMKPLDSGKVLFECPDPSRMLAHLLHDTPRDYPSDAVLKGVYIPQEGCFFELFYSLSGRGAEVCRLTEHEAQDSIFGAVLWQV